MERMPVFVGCVTLAAGAGLLAAPGPAARRLGLDEREHTALRAVGAADLVLVPGLLRGDPRWPWMIARAALNLAQAAYLLGAAERSSSPGAPKAGAAMLAGLTVADAATGLSLRRS